MELAGKGVCWGGGEGGREKWRLGGTEKESTEEEREVGRAR